MWDVLRMLLFGGTAEEATAQPHAPAPTRAERNAPTPSRQAGRQSAGEHGNQAGGQKLTPAIGRGRGNGGGGLSLSLAENLAALRRVFGASGDVVFRSFTIDGLNLPAALVYLDGLVENPDINGFLLRPLMQRGSQIRQFASQPPSPGAFPAEDRAPRHPLLRGLQQCVINAPATERTGFSHVVDDILAGRTILLIDTVPAALSIPQPGYEERNVQEPSAEALIRGPRDGFVESIRVNISLLRRKLRDPSLRLEMLRVGRRTNTDVAICYLEDVANPKIVDEIRTRIKGIDIDGVLESGYLEQIIEDHHLSPFPQIQNTERPDRAVANLLEGRVVVLVDGTPFCLILPSLFSQFYQVPEDYYERFLIATMVRGIRVVALFFSLTFTSLYVALISFHTEMLPTKFAVAVAGGRAGVPLPSVVEAFFMELTMEILREAAVRLPKAIGPTVSIVGALVIGEAAVRAGIVSPLMVIVVALTSVGSFAVPSYSAAIALRIVKFPIILAAGTLGLYGIMLAVIGLVVHLASLKSVGIPYLTPFAPARAADVKDTIFRMPLWSMNKRPAFLRTSDATRMPHKTDLLDDENLGVEGESGPGKPER